MSWGAVTVYSCYATSGALSSTSIDFGRAFNRVYLEVPTMASSSLYIMAAVSAGGTYRRILNPQGTTATVAQSTFTVDSAATLVMVPIPAGFRYLKVELSSGCTDVTTTFNFVCSD